jgi:hypothetical protein
MSFKPKSSKSIKINKSDIITLDNKHDEFIEKFHHNETVIIPKIEKEVKKLNNKLKNNNINSAEIYNIQEQIRKKKKIIKQKNKEKKEYFLNNSKYIFEYFENKKNISSDNNKPKLLEQFFNINSSKEKNVDKMNETNINKYFSNTNSKVLQVDNYVYNKELCQYCNEGELIPIDYEGIMVCSKCFKHVPYLFDQEKISYKDPPKEVCFYAYKRINHFREILAQFQAKETTQIPEQLIIDLKNQIKKERLELSQITNSITKLMLKKLGYNKYYEHIPFIKDKLGIKPPIMTQELEEKLCSLFLEIQRPYSRFCPDNRVNFLNYYYTVYKLCEMLNQRQFLEYFPMLKDREKRIEQDEIWKKICKALKWKFIPTI